MTTWWQCSNCTLLVKRVNGAWVHDDDMARCADGRSLATPLCDVEDNGADDAYEARRDAFFERSLS